MVSAVDDLAAESPPELTATPDGSGENEWRGAARPLGRLRHAMAYDSQSDRIVLFGGKSGATEIDDTWTYDFDANTWKNLNPAVKPSARGRHAMAYDIHSDRVVLFGGSSGDRTLNDTWSFDLNANQWLDRKPRTFPSPRYRHAMAYDSQSDRIILFGGTLDSQRVYDDTWAYDFATNTWTNMNPTNRPPARYRHAMAYDSESDRMILFGGNDNTTDLDDTWAYDVNTNAWTRLDPASRPAARSYPAMTYDAQSDRVVLFGGTGVRVLDDTWAYDWDANRWARSDPGSRPVARSYPAMTYDAQSDRVVLFGGTSGDSDLGDTWTFNLDSNEWTDMNPATKPSARGRYATAYHSRSDRIIMVGGVAGATLADTWSYDLNANRWTNRNPGIRVPMRSDFAIAYDNESDRILLFGGNATSMMDDTWAYDYNNNTWRSLDQELRPPARERHAMVYDSNSDRIILFGGTNQTTPFMNDTWAYDFNSNTWMDRNPATSTRLPGRYSHAMAYDSESDRTVLFGGIGSAAMTWIYDFTSNSWSSLAPPTGSPEFRYSHTMIYDSRWDSVVLFGGTKGPPAVLDDTWTFDVNAASWRNRTPSTGPPGRYGHAAAYDEESEMLVAFGGTSPASGSLGDVWSFDLNENTWTDVSPVTTPSARQLGAATYNSRLDLIVQFGGTGVDGTSLDDTWTYEFNTNRWQSKVRANRPLARSGHAMAYDAESDRVILFGGEMDATPLRDTWAYDLDNNTWRNMNPENKPLARSGHAMAYDPIWDKVLLFGGFSSVFVNDTWAYDFNTNNWTQVLPLGSSPPARHNHAATYHDGLHQVVLFGGEDSSRAPLDDTWAFDFNLGLWIKREPLARPPPRGGHAMAYDVQSNRVLVFGGSGESGSAELGDMWAYDMATWTSVGQASKPSPRSRPNVAFDTESDRMILFGGGIQATVLDDTWAYDFDANAWTNMNPTTKPEARADHALAYDRQSDRVVLFGGVSSATAFIGDTWAYDLNTNAWTNMNPRTRPTARSGHAVAYDSQSDRIILFGGQSGGLHADTWAYDVETNTWTDLTPIPSPPARSGHALAYDAQSGQLILFGGVTGGTSLADTWAYSSALKAWALRPPSSAPSARFGHSMVYDAESDRVILFGGTVAGQRNNETWSYDFNTDTWERMTPTASPSPRSDFAMVYDVEMDRVALFGGVSAGGVVRDDTWSYDLEGNRWADAQPRSRPTARFQHGMAYDSESDRVVMLGGASPAGASLDDTWWFHHPRPPTAPQSLVTAAGNAEVTLTWGPPAADGGSKVARYRIHRSGTSGGEILLAEIEATTPIFKDSSAENGVTYFYQVSAINAAGEGPRSNEASAAPVADLPGAPQELKVLFSGNSFVEIGWTAPTNTGGAAIIGYRILRATESGNESFLTEVDALSSTYNDTVLTNGFTYYYVVSARNAAGNSSWSNEVEATPRSRPSAPLELTAFIWDTRITLNWLPPASDGGTPILNYTIFRGGTAGTETVLAKIDPILSYTDVGLEHGTTYHYKVAAVNALGQGPQSTGTLAKTGPRAPDRPQSLDATASDARVSLSWNPPASSGGSPITEYRIYRGTAVAAKTLHRQIGGTILTFDDTGLTNGVTYYYNVSAVNAAGEGPRSNDANATPQALPTAPRELLASGGNALVTLTWIPPMSDGGATVSGYRIYRGTEPGATTFLIALGDVLTYTDTFVTNGVTYYYQVSAVNSLGEGNPSEPVSARPMVPSDVIVPAIAIASPRPGSVLSTSSVTVTGTASDDTLVAKVELSIDQANWTLASGTTSWSGVLALGEGEWTIYARVTDNAGNNKTESVTIIVRFESILVPLFIVGVPSAAFVGIIAAIVFLRQWKRRRKSPLFTRYERPRPGRPKGKG